MCMPCDSTSLNFAQGSLGSQGDPTKMYPVFRVFLLIYQSFSLEKRLGSQGSQKLSSLSYTIYYMP